MIRATLPLLIAMTTVLTISELSAQQPRSRPTPPSASRRPARREHSLDSFGRDGPERDDCDKPAAGIGCRPEGAARRRERD